MHRNQVEDMSLIKNIALLIVSPKMGWEEINLSGYPTHKVLQSGFYPVLALLAISSFSLMLYDPTAWTLSKTLMHAIVEFSSYFATYFLTSYLLGSLYPEIVKTATANARLNNFIAYNLIFLVLLEIFNNVLADGFSPIYFLLLYTFVIVYKGLDYINMKDEMKKTKFVAVASMLMICLPLVFRWTLEKMII